VKTIVSLRFSSGGIGELYEIKMAPSETGQAENGTLIAYLKMDFYAQRTEQEWWLAMWRSLEKQLRHLPQRFSVLLRGSLQKWMVATWKAQATSEELFIHWLEGRSVHPFEQFGRRCSSRHPIGRVSRRISGLPHRDCAQRFHRMKPSASAALSSQAR
jgi:hypothetical protein